MTIARSIASPIARSIASPLDGAGGGGGGAAPDPYGPELLANVALAGYVVGLPGTAPTSWFNITTTGSLADPALTFDCVNTRRGIYQTFAVTAGTFKAETTVTLNSGTATTIDALYCPGPAGTTTDYYLDDVLVTSGTSWTGTKRLKVILTVINSGTLEFRIGGGNGGNRTQNITHINPTLKKHL